MTKAHHQAAPRALAAIAAFASLLIAPAWARAADTPTAGALYGDGPSGRYLVGGGWYARPDPRNRRLRAGLQRRAGLAGWSPVTIPNAANAKDFSARSYLGGVEWYRKDFRLPAAPARSRWLLRFESVNYRASVWLNGRLLGRHTGAYLPFELQARALRRSGVNRLVVRVDSRRGALDVPSLGRRRGGRFVGGWWNYTGILREVYLRRVDGLDLDDVSVRPRLGCPTCAATVTIDTLVRNLGGRARSATAEAQVNGTTVDLGSARVPPRRARRLRASVRIDSPHLWSTADPYLYPVRIILRETRGGRELQSYDLQLGVRSLEVHDGRLLLNGSPVSLRGASLHEDDAQLGGAVTPASLGAQFDLLRDLGASMTRAHYPLSPLALELADRYGIVVWSEVPVYQMREALFRSDRVRRASLRMLREMVLRDRNHPSVIVWSLGNENTQKPGAGFRRYIREGKRAVRRLDPTRLTGLAVPGYPTVGRIGLYRSLDALGVNDYFGWYPGPAGSVGSRAALAPYLDSVHRYYPKQALFVTEFGAEANRAGPVTEKGTYEFQSDFLAYHLSVFATRPWINGALVWLMRDFRVKPGYDGGNPRPRPPVNEKGLVNLRGDRKPAFDVVRQSFAQTAGRPR